MTTESSTTNVIYDFSTSYCFFVIIGGKYLDMIGDVMEKVNSVSKDVEGTRPMAAFLISNNNYSQKINIDVDYGLDRYKSTPVMVG